MSKLIRYCIAALVGLAVLTATFPAYAHPTQEEHYKEIKAVLFGDHQYPTCKDAKSKIEDIEYASYLTIDQFKGDGKDHFLKLKEDGMSGLPLTFNTINYESHPDYPDKKINANTHHLYTHEGWDRDYSAKNSKAERFWTARRNVLNGTLNTLFNFSKVTLFGYNDKCNSLAGIIYYVHILGDYEEADNYKKIAYLTPLAGKAEIATEQDKDYDMITSLKSYITILFADQDTKDIIRELEKIEKKAGKIYRSPGGVNTDEEFGEYHGCAVEILEILKKYIPGMLRKETFFTDVFYPVSED